MSKGEKIELLSLPNKMGVCMSKNDYDKIANYINDTLESEVHKRIKLNELLDKARKDLDKEFSGNVSWYLLQVKNDMVVRGLIAIIFTFKRQQVVIKGASKKSKYRKSSQFASNDVFYFT